MKKLLIYLIAASSCFNTPGAETETSAALPEVVLLGDSIRMNYQSAVIEALKGKAVVTSPKENCKHSSFMLENLERWLSDAKGAQVIHINVGLHDLFLGSKTGKPRHPLELYETNLKAIFEKISSLTDAAVIFALTTAVNESQQAKSKGYGRVVRRNSDINLYNTAARRIARESGVVVNDLNHFMREKGEEAVLRSSDGIHLSPEGCEVMGTEVARIILEALKAENNEE